jgi:hypothetical protein
MRLASIAAPTATPSTWPVMRIWATVAEALPSLGLGTEPSTELREREQSHAHDQEARGRKDPTADPV